MSPERSFSAIAWDAISDIRTEIDRHPFLAGLRDGNLSRARYVEYLTQDAHYLIGYARALATCAAQAAEPDDISFWALSAHDSIVVERALHTDQVGDLTTVPASPTCAAYQAFLAGTAGLGCYPVLAAALLPCFWIYQDTGSRLTREVEPSGHPYGEWIISYGDPAFAASTRRARDIVDRLAEQSSPSVRQLMHQAFVRASRYEWMFFDAAWRGETWPAFATGSGPEKGRATSAATTNEAIEADSHG